MATTVSNPDVATSTRSARVERKRDQKMAQILGVTADVLAERGYHNLSLEEVAKRLDLNKASLYHYFSSKDELVRTCVEAMASSANSRLAAAADHASGSAAKRLRSLILVQLTIVLRDQPHLAVIFLQPLNWPDHYRKYTRALRLEHDAIFRAVVREGIDTGEFDVSEDIAMHNLYGAMNYTSIWLHGLSEKQFDVKADAIATNLLRLFVAG